MDGSRVVVEHGVLVFLRVCRVDLAVLGVMIVLQTGCNQPFQIGLGRIECHIRKRSHWCAYVGL